MSQEYSDAERIAHLLNSHAQELHRARIEDADVSQWGDVARQACEDAAREAGLTEVARDKNERFGAIIYRTSGGNLINLWTHREDEGADQEEFWGIGFDDAVEWYQGK